MSATKVLVVVALLCAVAVSVNAKDSYRGKTLKLTISDTSLTTFGEDSKAKLGDIGGLQYNFVEAGAKMYQSGIYVEVASKSKLLNYDLTLVLEKAIGGFPAGSIFLVGSGTGIQDSATLPKQIVGGSGPYSGARGTLTKKGDNAYIFKFTK